MHAVQVLQEKQEKHSHHVVASQTPATEVFKASETEQPVSSPKVSIGHRDKLYDCVHCSFVKDYIISHSVSGQRATTTAEAKPKFNEQLFSVFIAVIKTKFPQVAKKDITGKIQQARRNII